MFTTNLLDFVKSRYSSELEIFRHRSLFSICHSSVFENISKSCFLSTRFNRKIFWQEGNNIITNDQSEFAMCPTQRNNFDNELNVQSRKATS